MNIIEIWEPKWLTREVLVAPHHIKPGDNKIVFTKAKSPALIMDGRKMREYPLGTNGSIGVYKIPMDDFEKEDIINQEKLDI